MIHNSTGMALEEIEKLPLVGRIKNNWRRRMVDLYESPNPSSLYMVGRSFDGKDIIVTCEIKGMNEHTALDYWAHGNKVLVRD